MLSVKNRYGTPLTVWMKKLHRNNFTPYRLGENYSETTPPLLAQLSCNLNFRPPENRDHVHWC